MLALRDIFERTKAQHLLTCRPFAIHTFDNTADRQNQPQAKLYLQSAEHLLLSEGALMKDSTW